MAKFYGQVGYVQTKKTKPGVWEEEVTERSYVGDILKNTKKWVTSDKVIDDMDLSIRVSIVSDAYANQNIFAIKYIKWLGASWKVISIDIERPRLILTIGGLYNGPEATVADDSGINN